ncbi:glycosyltransferase [Nostocoides sp. F2B08]|uniref:glycosyltransferase n=1 Tax=Nostocoides sp. F2B08 TaxID=2653936 RepID=UPI00126353EA|nr:glycosyltransferase [Tetrasphaera sp. F2B08]KAB7746396.1 glycosyltransferase [Tetrasphaera sp. F2B08]
MAGRVIYLTRSWPRLSQTFIVGEVLALERLGVHLDIFALEPSGEELRQPQVDRVRATVTYLDRTAGWRDDLAAATDSPVTYAETAAFALRNPDLSSGYATATSWQCFRYAVHIAVHVSRLRAAGESVSHVHAHFAHDPALVAMFLHRLTGLPYSVTAHARDLYQIPQRSLRERAGAATDVLTCCRANLEYLGAELDAGSAAKARVIHHGVDLRQFAPAAPAARDSRVRILSVGRLVEKKGFPDLLRACAVVAGEHEFTLTIYGDGPLREELERLRDEFGLAETVELAGERDSSVIVDAMRSADIFAIAPYVTPDGDRDGVPNVIVEALASGLPVVSTQVGGVAEAVRHGYNGYLSAPHDITGLAEHIRALVTDPGLRHRMGAAARSTAEEHFDVDRAAAELVRVFGLSEAAT